MIEEAVAQIHNRPKRRPVHQVNVEVVEDHPEEHHQRDGRHGQGQAEFGGWRLQFRQPGNQVFHRFAQEQRRPPDLVEQGDGAGRREDHVHDQFYRDHETGVGDGEEHAAQQTQNETGLVGPDVSPDLAQEFDHVP